jgi:hypothetical protein
MKDEEQKQADRDAAEGRHYQAKPPPLAARIWRWAFVGVAAATILLSALILSNFRPPPTPEANVPVGPAQPGGGQLGSGQQAGGQSGGGAAGGAGSAAGDCAVPPEAVIVTMTKVKEEPPNQGAWNSTWNLVFTNTTNRELLVVGHRQRRSAAQKDPEKAESTTEWLPGTVMKPLATYEYPSWRTQYRYVAGQFWNFFDRYAVLAGDPACWPSVSAAAKDPAVLDQVARDAPAQPLGR